MAKRIVAAGMKLVIDFHYSDTWADPGHQTTPAAWASMTHTELVSEVETYTKDFISGLIAQGTTPWGVQIGNEITAGMLWPDGYLDGSAGQWQNFTDLVKAGVQGVKDAEGTNPIKIIIHIDRGGDNTGARYFFDNLDSYSVPFDIIGLSYYTWWHGPVANMVSNVNDLGPRYKKPIFIAETMYPWTLTPWGNWGRQVYEASQIDANFPATIQGQTNYLDSLLAIVQDIPGGYGEGVFFWAPEYIDDPVYDSAFDNVIPFDEQDNALPGLAALGGAFQMQTAKTLAYGAGSISGTVTLPGETVMEQAMLTLSSSAPTVASVQSSTTITVGQVSTSFLITTKGVSKLSTAVITATWAGITKSIEITVKPALLSFSLTSTSVQSGAAISAIVHLAGISATGGEAATVTASGPVTVPASFTVPAGWTAASFPVTATGDSVITNAKIYATLGSTTLSATLTVTPAAVISLSFSPTPVVAGAKTLVTIRLNGPAGPSGDAIKLTGSGPATLPSSVLVPSTKNLVEFEISTSAVTTQTGMSITASFGSSSVAGDLLINPVALSSFSLTESTVIGGQETDGHILLNGPAPTGGLAVKLAATGPVTVPATVTVPANASSYYFEIKTTAVKIKTTATITATYASVSSKATLTLTP
jgi:arabinogalactan endo-1,4-beta-galactosidase